MLTETRPSRGLLSAIGDLLLPKARLQTALRELAAIKPYVIGQAAPFLQNGAGYEFDKSYARIQVEPEVSIPDARDLFALLSEHAAQLTRHGKVTIIVGVEPLPGQERTGVRVDFLSRTLTFMRDSQGRLPMLGSEVSRKDLVDALNVFPAF
jgi:hypothetical protein